MAEHDDAVSPTGERKSRSSGSVRLPGPLGKAWSWFNAQPAQTKVIVVGVIVVLGVVAWMAFRKSSTATDTSQEDVQPGPFRSNLGWKPGGVPADTPTTAAPPIPGSLPSGSTSGPVAQMPAATPPAQSAPRPMPTMTAQTTTAASSINTPPPAILPTAQRPPVTYPITPAGMTPTMRGTDVLATTTPLEVYHAPAPAPAPAPTPITGATFAPKPSTVISRITIPRKAPTPQVARPTVITAVPTQRGTNISF